MGKSDNDRRRQYFGSFKDAGQNRMRKKINARLRKREAVATRSDAARLVFTMNAS